MNKKIIIGLFLVIITIKVHAHAPDGWTWTTLSTYRLYDSKNNNFLQSFNLNIAHTIINGGVEYKNISYIDSKKFSGYIGLGLLHLIQLQAGFSKDGFSIKNRYDMLMGDLDIFSQSINLEKYPLLKLISVSISIEKYFNNPQMKYFFGIGIGFSINNSYGFDYPH